MISKYTFYCRYNEYHLGDEPEEFFDVNNHKVSKEIYSKLLNNIRNDDAYEIYTTQNCFWKNHKTKSFSQSTLITYERNSKSE